MAYRSRNDGSHYPIHPRRRGLYGNKPRSKTYSETLSEIHEPEDAREAAEKMEEEFKQHETREGKVHVKKALVERANRAKVASHNKRLTPEERQKEKKIAEIFYRAEKKMVLADPPRISRREKHTERSAVHEEAEGHEKYLRMEETAKEEGRPEAAEIYHEHALDEERHEKEDREAEKIKAA
jgi:hypothetical protein